MISRVTGSSRAGPVIASVLCLFEYHATPPMPAPSLGQDCGRVDDQVAEAVDGRLLARPEHRRRVDLLQHGRPGHDRPGPEPRPVVARRRQPAQAEPRRAEPPNARPK